MIWQHLRSESIAQAICLTLAHSLWQSVLLAFLASMIILLTTRSKAVARYGWLVAALGLFTLTFLITLVIELNNQNTCSHTASVAPAPTSPISRMFDACMRYSQDHAPTIVNCWLLIMAIRSLWLLFGLYSLERMRWIHVKSPGPDWAALLSRFATQMRITRIVTLLESGLVSIPLTAGYLKPVILIPAGIERLVSRRSQSMHKWELLGLALVLTVGVCFTSFSPARFHRPTKYLPEQTATDTRAFKAKRKAEASAIGRLQSSPNL